MAVLGLIPARAGSKGIPGKNLAPLAGRPLLAYACEAALGSGELARVVVSTDSEEIAEAARGLGVEAPFLRPAALAGDEAPMLAVVEHALAELGGFDAVALLQPTSPLRTARHVDEAVRLWRESGADTVVSVVAVPHNFVPSSLMRVVDGELEPLGDLQGPLRRQDKERLVARNGPAVLVTSAAAVGAGSLYGERVVPYPMDAEASIDVDGPLELRLAECLLRARA